MAREPTVASLCQARYNNDMAAKWFSFVVGFGLLALGIAAYSGVTLEGGKVVAVSVISGLVGMKIGLTDARS